MLAPLLIVSSSGWAWTNSRRRSSAMVRTYRPSATAVPAGQRTGSGRAVLPVGHRRRRTTGPVRRDGVDFGGRGGLGRGHVLGAGDDVLAHLREVTGGEVIRCLPLERRDLVDAT